MRITPKTGAERPKFNFNEMDGMLRVSPRRREGGQIQMLRNTNWWLTAAQIAFNRKNRTMRASFSSKEVLAMLARNYRVYASMHGIAVDDSLVEEGDSAEGVKADDNDDDGMDVDNDDGGGDEADGDEWNGITGGGADANDNNNDDDDDDMPAFFKESAYQPPAKTPSRRKRTKVDELVRAKVLRVLERLELADRRARQCDEGDFLRLLDAVRLLFSFCLPSF